MLKFCHEDFVKQFGKSYREECRKYFIQAGVIGEEHDLNWLDPDHKLYTHEGSAANYILWTFVNEGKDLVIVSIIPPKSYTSAAHDHPKNPHVVIEKYKSIKGEFELLLNGKPKRIKTGETFDVMPGVKHRVKTNGSWALLAIVTQNGGLYPPEQLHRR